MIYSKSPRVRWINQPLCCVNTWTKYVGFITLQWRHNELDGFSNNQPHDCLLNCLFTHRSKKTLKLRVTGLCVGNSPVTGKFPAQRVSNAEIFSIWWRHNGYNNWYLLYWMPPNSASCQVFVSSSTRGQNGRHFADDSFRRIFVN